MWGTCLTFREMATISKGGSPSHLPTSSVALTPGIMGFLNCDFSVILAGVSRCPAWSSVAFPQWCWDCPWALSHSYASFLQWNPSKICAHLVHGVFVLLLSLECALHVLHPSPPGELWLASISQSVACLSVLFTASFKGKFLNFEDACVSCTTVLRLFYLIEGAIA